MIVLIFLLNVIGYAIGAVLLIGLAILAIVLALKFINFIL